MMDFNFTSAKTGEDVSINIFPMNLTAVKEIGDRELLDKAFDIKAPIDTLIAKLDIISYCTDEEIKTLGDVLDPFSLADCFSKCMELSGFTIQEIGTEKKTITP